MNLKRNKFLSVIMSVIMLIGVTFGSAPNVFAEDKVSDDSLLELLSGNVKLTQEQMEELKDGLQLQPLDDVFSELNENAPSQQKAYKPNDDVKIIVEMNSRAVVDMVPYGELREGANNQELTKTVLQSQDATINSMYSINDSIRIDERFNVLINGFSAEAKYKDIERIKALPSVKRVSLVNYYRPMMNNARKMTGNIEKINNTLGLKGEGIVVSIIDSGIDWQHKDMRITTSSAISLTREDIAKAQMNDERLSKGRYFTKKVPFGYNYADGNQQVRHQPNTSPHGSHVSGIVAGNCTDEDFKNGTGIRGIAPEAQLLAMKVFPDEPDSQASTDIIVTAIEDSVKLGADIMNMSLGATAGYQVNPGDVELTAIKKAAEKGVMSIISAGNEAYSTYPTMIREFKDTATVGSPGTAKEALTVASYENSRTKLPTFGYNVNGIMKYGSYIGGGIDPVGVLKNEDGYEVVYCGLGKETDFKDKDLNGKIALIKRGELDFVAKQMNAQKNGAVAVIIFNHESGKDELMSMQIHQDLKIPAVFTTNSFGTEVLNNIDNIKLTFEGKEFVFDNFNADEMSDYTSWGPTPELSLKPEISGIGGDVYSTVRDNKYEVRSGTSMSSPYIAGFTALYLQQLKNEGIKIEGIDKVNFVKQILINSAEPVIDKTSGLPSSPRRQGAGLVNMDNTLKNKVTATYDGEAVASLREIDGKITFPIVVTNYSNKPVKFKVANPFGVLTEQFEKDLFSEMSYEMPLPGAELTFDKTEFEVTTGSPITIKATLKVSGETPSDSFAEGFIKFESLTNDVPSIGMPFMGFYGDWANLTIFDNFAYEENSFFGMASMLLDDDGLGYMALDKNGAIHPEAFSFNPNSGKKILPSFSLMRNAKDTKVEVVDKDNNVLHEIVDVSYLRKEATQDGDPDLKLYDLLMWNGKLEDGSVLPDGQYSVKISCRFNEKGEWQFKEMPLKIDTEAPIVYTDQRVVTVNGNKAKVQFNSMDLSPISRLGYIVSNVENEKEEAKMKIVDVLHTYNSDTKTFSADFELPYAYNLVSIISMDAAGNIGLKNGPALIINEEKAGGKLNITKPALGEMFSAGEEVQIEYTSEEYIKAYDIKILGRDSEGNTVYKTVIPTQEKSYSLGVLPAGNYTVVVEGKKDLNDVLMSVGATYFTVTNGDTSMQIKDLTEKTEYKNGDQANIIIEISNMSKVSMDAALIVGVFDDQNRMVTTAGSKQLINGKAKVQLNALVNIPETGNYTLRAFVWDDMKAGKPLSNVIEYKVVEK